jgi:hypothetical protein
MSPGSAWSRAFALLDRPLSMASGADIYAGYDDALGMGQGNFTLQRLDAPPPAVTFNLGPGGRSFEQVEGQPYVSEEERVWWLTEARRRGRDLGPLNTAADEVRRMQAAIDSVQSESLGAIAGQNPDALAAGYSPEQLDAFRLAASTAEAQGAP